MKNIIALILVLSILIFSCQDKTEVDQVNFDLNLEHFDYYEEDIPFLNSFFANKVKHDEIAALGRLLFYDTRLSLNNSISCASCHKQHLGFTDNKRFSEGIENYTTSRNSMTLVNNAFQISHFWEGHGGLLSDHILNPISNHIEMGMRSAEQLSEKLKSIEQYEHLFQDIFEEEISEDLIRDALTTFVGSIISYNTKFDKGIEIDFANFSLSEKNGESIFFGKGKCGHCHRGNHFAAFWRESTNIGLDLEYTDQGAGNGNFKVPTLRNIALTGPYMHDGRFETLEEVVNHYVNGIQEHPRLDWTLQNSPIDLNEEEQEDLVAFLHTLTDYDLITQEKFSNPFK